MMQRLRFRLSELSMGEENENLRSLLEHYINRSEELVKKESRVMKQVELLQVALASLQAWNKETSRKISTAPARISAEQIEEETREIREETKRIQEEVRQKIEENKKLQDEINRRKTMEAKPTDEFVTDDYIRRMEEETRQQRIEREEIESRALSSLNEDPGLKFFNEKLRKLREMEERLKKESSEEETARRRKRQELKRKIEMLEWESQVDRKLIHSLKKKLEKN